MIYGNLLCQDASLNHIWKVLFTTENTVSAGSRNLGMGTNLGTIVLTITTGLLNVSHLTFSIFPSSVFAHVFLFSYLFL